MKKAFRMTMTVVGIAVAFQAGAATYTWTGPATGASWTQASNNWDAASTPVWDSVNGPGNSANVTNAVTNTVGEAIYVSNITFKSATMLTNDASYDAINLSTGGAISTTNSGWKSIMIFPPVVGSNTTINANGTIGDGIYLYGTNTFTGMLTVQAPSGANSVGIYINKASALGYAQVRLVGPASDKAYLVVDADMTISNDFILNGDGGGGGNGRIRVAGNTTFTGEIVLTNSSYMCSASKSVVVNGTVSGAQSTLKLGTGNTGILDLWTFGGANSFSNLLIQSSIAVKLNNAAALNATAGSESGLTFDRNPWNTTQSAYLRLNGNSVTIASVTNLNALSRPIIENSNSVPATLTIGNVRNLDSVYDGVIRDGAGGALSLAKAGTGKLTLSGTNTYSGATTVNNGTLKLAAFFSASTNSAVTAAGGVYDLGGLTATNKSAGTSGSGVISNGTLVANSFVFSGGTDYAILAGAGALTNVGGTTTLAATNTYSGVTVISNGTLVVNGLYAGGGTVTVLSNATLQGTSPISNLLCLAGGILSAPTTSSVLTVGNGGTLGLTNAVLAVTVDAAGNSGKLAVNGNLVMTNCTVSVTGTNLLDYHKEYIIATWTGSGPISPLTGNLPTGWHAVAEANRVILQGRPSGFVLNIQ